MVSDKCHGQCEHMCPKVPYGIAGVKVIPQPMHGHLGKHICVACFQFLSTGEAGIEKMKEMRQAVFRRMAGTASQINSTTARHIGILAQMVELEWPRVEDHCDPVLLLDTSDEEEESARLDRRFIPSIREDSFALECSRAFFRDVQMDAPISLSLIHI